VTVPPGTTVDAQRAEVDGVFRAVQAELPQYRVVWQGNAGAGSDALLTSDRRTTYGIVVVQKLTGFEMQPAFRVAEPVLAAQQERTGFDITTTGFVELSEATPAPRAPSRRAFSARRSCPPPAI
jgi:hypothetical protein